MWLFQLALKRHFTAEERKTVEALFTAILPGDDNRPGAADAGAADYLDCLLAMEDSLYYELAAWKELYAAGLSLLDEASSRRFGGRRVSRLEPAQVMELLTQLASGLVPGLPTSFNQRQFFATIRNHCIEGCFADPRWGGNRDALMWRWFGYIDPPKDFNRPSTSGTIPGGRRGN